MPASVVVLGRAWVAADGAPLHPPRGQAHNLAALAQGDGVDALEPVAPP